MWQKLGGAGGDHNVYLYIFSQTIFLSYALEDKQIKKLTQLINHLNIILLACVFFLYKIKGKKYEKWKRFK